MSCSLPSLILSGRLAIFTAPIRVSLRTESRKLRQYMVHSSTITLQAVALLPHSRSFYHEEQYHTSDVWHAVNEQWQETNISHVWSADECLSSTYGHDCMHNTGWLHKCMTARSIFSITSRHLGSQQGIGIIIASLALCLLSRAEDCWCHVYDIKLSIAHWLGTWHNLLHAILGIDLNLRHRLHLCIVLFVLNQRLNSAILQCDRNAHWTKTFKVITD